MWCAETLAPPRKAGARSAAARTTAFRPQRAWRHGGTRARWPAKAVVVWLRPGVRSRLRRGTRPEDPSPRAAKSPPHASLKWQRGSGKEHSRTCPACPAYGACRVAAARASATYCCRQRATYRWRSQLSASSRVDPLALGAEDGERFGRAVDGPEPVRGAAGELGGLAGLEDEVVVAEHEPQSA